MRAFDALLLLYPGDHGLTLPDAWKNYTDAYRQAKGLLLIVEGESIQTVAEFVSSKLSSMENVRQTATHFLLKKYKEDGQTFRQVARPKRLAITY